MRYDTYEIIRKYDTLQQIKLFKKKCFAYIIKSNAFHTAPRILLKPLFVNTLKAITTRGPIHFLSWILGYGDLK